MGTPPGAPIQVVLLKVGVGLTGRQLLFKNGAPGYAIRFGSRTRVVVPVGVLAVKLGVLAVSVEVANQLDVQVSVGLERLGQGEGYFSIAACNRGRGRACLPVNCTRGRRTRPEDAH